MEMNLQLYHIVSDITGATGMRTIRTNVAGERSPDVLASYRDVRCHASIQTNRAELVATTATSMSLRGFFTAPIRPRWQTATAR